MGTRSLISVVKNGETKVAQYSQWDGYPTGQGNEILSFLREVGLAKLEANLPRCHFITDEEAEAADKELQAGTKTMARDFPLLSRDHGAGVLTLIANAEGSEPLLLRDSSEFATNGLFCEWAYTLDLDSQTLRIYKGGTNLVKSYLFSEVPRNFTELEKEIYANQEE